MKLTDLFKDKSAKRLCKTLQTLFSRDNFYEELLLNSLNDIELFFYNLGKIIEYYIKTRDTKTDYSVSVFLEKIIPEMWNSQGTKENIETIENVITKGFVTHSCNGLFKKGILNSGMGASENRDKELEEKLKYLEAILGKSMYLVQQKNTSNEIYFTSPGATSIYYATSQSPERLFLGILSQERDSAIPIKVGENKKDYFNRVISSKLDNMELTNKTGIKKIAEEVIDKFFEYNPLIVFVPMFSKNYRLKTSMSSLNDGLSLDIEERLKQEFGDDYSNIQNFFSHNATGGWGVNNFDDLVTENVVISPKELGILEIPSRYDFLQMRAKNFGLKNGDYIDYFTGDEVKLKPMNIEKIGLERDKKNEKEKLLEQKRILENYQNNLQYQCNEEKRNNIKK